MSDQHKEQLSTQCKKSGWSDVYINVNAICSTPSQDLSEKENLRVVDLDSYLQYLQNEMGSNSNQFLEMENPAFSHGAVKVCHKE